MNTGGLILGYFSGYWLVSQWLASLVLIGWMLYKLHGLQSWIEEGQPDEKMPDSDGAWEQMTYTVHRRRNTNSRNCCHASIILWPPCRMLISC